MSQSNIQKRNAFDQSNQSGAFYGLITNIEEAIERIWLKSSTEPRSDELLNNTDDVKALEDTFTKAVISAKIIKTRLGQGDKERNILTKLAILGHLQKMDQQTKEKLQVTSLLIPQGTPVSQISGRDLPSPAEIRADTNMLLLPFYQEV